MPKRVSQEKRTRIVSMYQAGESQAEIAKETGVTTPTIRAILDAADVARRPYRATQELQQRAVELNTAGRGYVSIAREMGLSPMTVLKLLKASGVYRQRLENRHNRLKELPLEEIAHRYGNGSGESLKALAAEFGVSFAGLRERLEKENLIAVRRMGSDRATAFEFIQIWQEASSLAEAASLLGVSKVSAGHRAVRYRQRGVPLRYFSRQSANWDEIIEFASLFDAAEEE